MRVEVDGTPFEVRALEGHRLLRRIPASAIAVGSTVWVRRTLLGSPALDDLLRHEAQHVRDWRRFGPLFWLTYLLALPVGPSLRAVWEWRAYRVSLRAAFERHGEVDEATRRWVVGAFCGAAPYWWMWPFPRQVRRWVDAECRALAGRSPPADGIAPFHDGPPPVR
jgi:hypothetical protein